MHSKNIKRCFRKHRYSKTSEQKISTSKNVLRKNERETESYWLNRTRTFHQCHKFQSMNWGIFPIGWLSLNIRVFVVPSTATMAIWLWNCLTRRLSSALCDRWLQMAHGSHNSLVGNNLQTALYATNPSEVSQQQLRLALTELIAWPRTHTYRWDGTSWPQYRWKFTTTEVHWEKGRDPTQNETTVRWPSKKLTYNRTSVVDGQNCQNSLMKILVCRSTRTSKRASNRDPTVSTDRPPISSRSATRRRHGDMINTAPTNATEWKVVSSWPVPAWHQTADQAALLEPNFVSTSKERSISGKWTKHESWND